MNAQAQDRRHNHNGVTHSPEETPTTPNIATGSTAKFLVVPQEGDAYYPSKDAFYVGGDIYTVLASAQDTGGAIAALDFYVPPKDVFPQHTHAHEAEAKYLVEGNVSFQFGDISLTSPPGTFVYYPPGRPMGFNATDRPARLTVLALPGASYYELAGVPLRDEQSRRIPPPQADLEQLQQQVDLGNVGRLNATYGGTLYFPEIAPPPPSGLLDTVLVLPSFDTIPADQLNSLRAVEGLKVFELEDRLRFNDAFGIEHITLVTGEESDNTIAYSQFSLPVQSGNSFFPEPVVTRNHETIFVTEGELSFQIEGQTKSAPANTFVYIAPGQSYAIANFGDRQAKAVASTIVDSYIPKIGQYLEGNQPFIGTVSRGDEFIQGNVTSTKPQAIGDGWIYTWGAFDSEGSPSSIGVTFTQEVLSNNQGLDAFQVTDPNNRFPRLVPHLALTDQFDAARVYDIPFPQEVVAKTPFNHMGFYANSQGHAPLMVYDTPHFDVHFFISSLEDRDLITGLPQDNANLFNFPPNGFLNRDYIAPTVPGTDIPATGDALQGVHWVDRNTPEFNGGEFSQTFIFGTYAGQVNFWEPMITKEFMEELSASGERTTKKTFAIKQPTRFLEDGYYPLEYSITYNRDFGEYTISLDNLTFRSDNPLGGLPPIPGGMPPMMM